MKKKIIIIIEDILHSIPRNNLHKVMNKVYIIQGLMSNSANHDYHEIDK